MKSLSQWKVQALSILAVFLCLTKTAQCAAEQTPGEEAVDLPLPVDRVQVKEGAESVATFSGKEFALGAATGEPALPTYCLKVLLPPNADLKSIRVTIVCSGFEDIPGQLDMLPMPAAMSRGKAIQPAGLVLVNGRSAVAYARDAFRPESPLGLVLPGQMREWRFVEVEVHPYQYNPVSKSLRKLASGSLHVGFRRTAEGRSVRSRSQEMALLCESRIRQSVVNFSAFSSEYKSIQAEKR